MEDELFDEPRVCSVCHVETYCDNCPVCGKKLPRSTKAAWKLLHKNDVAGEERSSSENANFERFEERILKSMHYGSSLSANKMENADHVDPSLDFNPQENRRYGSRNSSYKKPTRDVGKTIAVAVAIAFIIIILVGLFGFIGFRTSNSSSSSTSTILGNSEYLINEVYSYSEKFNESTMEIVNKNDMVYAGDIVLYNEVGERIGEYEDLIMLPYERFQIDIYSKEEAHSFEINEENYVKLRTEKPQFQYSTFNDYGDLRIYLESDIDEHDLEILVNYLFEASTIDDYEELYMVDIYVNDRLYYYCDIRVYEQEVVVYPEDSSGIKKDFFSFSLVGNTIDSRTSTGIDL